MRTALALGLFGLCVCDTFGGDVDDAVMRGVFLAGALALHVPVLQGLQPPRGTIGWALDIVLALAGDGCRALHRRSISRTCSAAPAPTRGSISRWRSPASSWCWRRRGAPPGWPLPLLSVVFLLYPLWYGPLLPGLLRTGSFSLERVLTLQYLSLEGVLGSALAVTIEYVFLFVVYGAFLSRLGAIEFMDELSKALCGRARGGSAKIATVSSLFMGLASGSAVANVVSQGVFTIPMMRREGYKPAMAGAIEAAASTGGQIMPPVMGAAAFLMAEYTRIPYSQIILHALIPGLLFYFAIWYAVHWEAVRTGMKGVPADRDPERRPR